MSVKDSSVMRPEAWGRRRAISTATVAVIAVAASSDVGRAANYSFNYTSSMSGAWSNSSYWLADNSPAASAPGATDDMITPTGVSSTSGNGTFGTLSVDGARSIRTITYAPTSTLSNAAWTAYGNASASVTVDQTVSVSSGNFTIRSTGSYRLRAYRTGYRHNDAYSAYIDMGLPKTLDAAQRRKLQQLTRDQPIVDRVVTVGAGGQFHLDLPMRSNDVVLVKLSRESSASTASCSPSRT